jgi:hypothetical protein
MLTVALGACVASPAPAHHSEAAYDAETVVAFEGTVTRYGWRNPHVYIGVSVADGSGEPAEWLVETGATPIMVRSGWTPESLVPGDVVTVRAHRDKQPGRLRAILLSMTKADGTVLAQHDGTPEQPHVRASTLNGVWSGRSETIVSFNQALNATPLTPVGTAAREQYDFRRDNPVASCVGPPAPGIITAAFLYLSEIEIGAEIVTIRNEFFDVVRTVHMDARQHPERRAQQSGALDRLVGRRHARRRYEAVRRASIGQRPKRAIEPREARRRALRAERGRHGARDRRASRRPRVSGGALRGSARMAVRAGPAALPIQL